jgi:hypothetical protein
MKLHRLGFMVLVLLVVFAMGYVPQSQAGGDKNGSQVCGKFGDPPCPKGQLCDPNGGQCGETEAEGVCVMMPDKVCPNDKRPTCGCDGKTYGSDCLRQKAGVMKAHLGACKESPEDCGFTGCAKGYFCDRAAGKCGGADIEGVCVKLDGICLEVEEPVCGCDGKTYGNDCKRMRVQKAQDGMCKKQ